MHTVEYRNTVRELLSNIGQSIVIWCTNAVAMHRLTAHRIRECSPVAVVLFLNRLYYFLASSSKKCCSNCDALFAQVLCSRAS